MVGCRDGGDWL